MQLFATHSCPFASAAYLSRDKVRTFKIAIEGMQLLSTALGGPYKRTHPHHPLAYWVAADRRNLNWAFWYVTALLMQHRKSGYSGKAWRARKKLRHWLGPDYFRMSLPGPEKFCNASAHPGEVHEAYRQTLADKWDTAR